MAAPQPPSFVVRWFPEWVLTALSYAVGAVVFAVALLIVGCGGAGSDSPQPSTQPIEPPPPPIHTVSFAFVGTFGDLGTCSGSMTYPLTDEPIKVNVMNQTNKVYRPQHWAWVMPELDPKLPGKTFSDTLGGQTAEWCIGFCQFANPQPIAMLSLRDGTGLLVLIVFTLKELQTDPPTVEQMKGWQSGIYRVENSVPVAIMSAGVVTAS